MTKKEERDLEIVSGVIEDFKRRQEQRQTIEAQWKLNINFLNGKQYSRINGNYDIVDTDDNLQHREVFNHIAPIVETRLAKLSRVRPTMSVLASSNSENDVNVAKLSTKILNASYDQLMLDKIIGEVTLWSEICGTAFYKIVWDQARGAVVGFDNEGNITDGDVKITCCPPYEIYPDSNGAININDCESIIHAKCYSVSDIKKKWNVNVESKEIDIFSLESTFMYGSADNNKKTKKDANIVIEKYIKPSKEFKNGRLIIVAGDKLVYDGELPYINKDKGRRGFPFVKQTSINKPGSFWGISVIERVIPVQRAYNIVKNRKHEYLNRIAGGVLVVEDGSVDMDNIEEEGLKPGKVLVYRQGSIPPSMVNLGSVPPDFSYEEEKLLNEFILISGISEIMRNSSIPSSISSGTALSLLIEQDDTRLSLTAEGIRMAVKEVAKGILKLYKQFVKRPKLLKIAGTEGSVEVFYFSSSEIESEDIVFDTDNELTQTPAQKRNMIMELLSSGLLHDENGKLNNRERAKILELLGFGSFERAQDIAKLHIKRAEEENILLEKEEVEVSFIDDHDTHIVEHKRYVLTKELKSCKDEERKRYLKHIKEHIRQKELLFNEQLKNTEDNNI